MPTLITTADMLLQKVVRRVEPIMIHGRNPRTPDYGGNAARVFGSFRSHFTPVWSMICEDNKHKRCRVGLSVILVWIPGSYCTELILYFLE